MIARAALVASVALALSACEIQVNRTADQTTTTTERPTTTTAATTTTTSVYVPPPPSEQDVYNDNLEYLGAYCWSDCSRAYPDELDYYIDTSTLVGRMDAVAVMADLAYWELDGVCDQFWVTPDSDIIGSAIGYRVDDPNGMLAALWYTCDS